MMFNIMVDEVVWEVLAEVCRTQEDHRGLGWTTRESNLLFYADDGRIVGRDLDWLHNTLSVMVDISGRVGLETNLEKTI